MNCMIVGIDEVGRGPWAGPLVFGAVVLGTAEIEGLTDSKKLNAKRRQLLNEQIYNKAEAVGLGWVEANEIDELGLRTSLSLACRRALEQIQVPYQQIIIDGTVNFLKETGKGPYVTTMKQADLLVPSVSAASIVAKVARDAYMAKQDELYPGYGFASHVGYGTAQHRQAIETLGVTPLHRLSFAPLTSYAEPTAVPPALSSSGARGEDAAADYLRRHSFKIHARNWKTRACEIDIIAEKDNVIYFVEVKYRSSADQGGGVAAITPKKLRHMQRAAALWMQRHGEREARLSVIEVAGKDFLVTEFLEQV